LASSPATVTVSSPSSPVISITGQPQNINVTEGNISSSLTVFASVTQSAMLSYQWYSNTKNCNLGGTLIQGASLSSFTLPTNLTAASGPYYYYCVVSATGGAPSVVSTTATVTVTGNWPVKLYGNLQWNGNSVYALETLVPFVTGRYRMYLTQYDSNNDLYLYCTVYDDESNTVAWTSDTSEQFIEFIMESGKQYTFSLYGSIYNYQTPLSLEYCIELCEIKTIFEWTPSVDGPLDFKGYVGSNSEFTAEYKFTSTQSVNAIVEMTSGDMVYVEIYDDENTYLYTVNNGSPAVFIMEADECYMFIAWSMMEGGCFSLEISKYF
jgi:hypothetical protein